MELAQRHFLSKLSVETDASDVHTDLSRGQIGFVIVDARTTAGRGYKLQH
ncbi:MAG: hypothetical protein L0Y66_17325 [Myxococcaceae bacterium]|nr:hypothetical protein [Myxococcaceae bacterium]